MNEFSFKDFEKVRLKATQNIEIGNRTYSKGETVLMFDKIKIAGLQEIKKYVTAHGGYEDRDRVFWEITKDLQLQFSQGVFSKEQYAVFANSKVFQLTNAQSLYVTKREFLETDENGKATLKEVPQKDLFVYRKDTKEKISNYTIENKELSLEDSFLDIMVDYQYDYNNTVQIMKVGQRLFNGFFELEGLTRFKDDTTGQVVTGMIYIPKLKLMSDLSITLGSAAQPNMTTFSGLALPVGSRGNSWVTDFVYLSDDIESDF